jgi:hypothetical protein
MKDDSSHTQAERRVHHAVRKIFVQACVLLAPYVKDNDKIFHTSSFAMLHVVQDRFPELSGSEARIAIATVERLSHEGRLQALLEKQEPPIRFNPDIS